MNKENEYSKCYYWNLVIEDSRTTVLIEFLNKDYEIEIAHTLDSIIEEYMEWKRGGRDD